MWCLFFNFIGGSALLISDGSQVAAWLWSAIWFVGGVPGAYPQLAGLYGGPSMWAFGGEGER